MVTYKNVRVKMRSGKTRLQRAMVLASGKLKFVKNPSRVTATWSRSKAPRQTTKRRTPYLRRSKKRSYRSFNPFNLGVKVAKVAAIAAPAYYEGMKYPVTSEKIVGGLGSLAGYNLSARKFDGWLLVRQWSPFIAVSVGAVLVRKISGMIRRA